MTVRREGSIRDAMMREVSAHPQRSQSDRLLRAASRTFTGGATVLPEAPIEGRPSMRRMQTSTVQERMLEELWNRYYIPIGIFTFTLVLFSFTMVGLFYGALYAVFVYGSLPCDQPLDWYLLVSLVIGQISPHLLKFMKQRWRPRTLRQTETMNFLSSVPGWMVMVWGLSMVRSCRTCQETNPMLFYATKCRSSCLYSPRCSLASASEASGSGEAVLCS